MAEYIEREALLADIQAAVDNGGMGGVAAGTLKRYVKRIPAANVVEVVRCGECVHWDKAGFCHHPAGMSYCGERAAKVGFCYFGERRGGHEADS